MRHLRLMARPLPVKASCENTYALYLSIGFIRKVFTSCGAQMYSGDTFEFSKQMYT